MRPARVPLAVAGRCRVAADVLRSKLGTGAWFVLHALWALRGARDGTTHVTNGGLSRVRGFAPISPRAARHAVERLRAAGLVESVGWQRRRVAVGACVGERVVCVRRVRGAPAEGALGADAVVFVPRETVDWLGGASSWGGARPGAGRPPSDPSRCDPKRAARERDTAAGVAPLENVIKRGNPRIQEGHTPPNSSGAPDILCTSGVPIPVNRLASLGDAAALTTRSAAVVPCSNSGGPNLGSGPLGMLHRGVAPELVGAAPVESVGGIPPPDGPSSGREGPSGALSPLGGCNPPSGAARPSSGALLSETWAPRPKGHVLPSTPLSGLPPPPWALVGVAAVPNPPTLDTSMTDRERAIRLADAYRGAVRARLRLDAFAFKRGDVTRSKHYPTLVEAAAFMLAHELAPAAWCAWSCDVWRQYAGGRKPPPIPWVFGAKRLAERRGWFEAEEGAYTGGRVSYGPEQSRLVQRYLAARLEIDRAGAFASPEGVFAKWFPGDAYERAVERARVEVERASTSLRRDADMGVFLW